MSNLFTRHLPVIRDGNTTTVVGGKSVPPSLLIVYPIVLVVIKIFLLPSLSWWLILALLIIFVTPSVIGLVSTRRTLKKALQADKDGTLGDMLSNGKY